ncbi:hypothetical protein C8F04DRAFT_1364812 [Mycena alexandri]|uniref:Uncharacterized protein n=1 Tax=Mycena alexandri TaxID=1745969 RepID=A0AAD6SN42_9AGAR|nr:hypothetical protein C8F04DRAFT_1364812 [Mycena alexandri]
MLDQKAVEHRVHMPDMERVIDVPPSSVTSTNIFAKQQPSAPSYKVGAVREFGETVRAPLGLVGHGRSGDKGSDSNFLSVYRMKKLLAKEYNGKERDSTPFISCSTVHDHLDRGVSCTSTVDFLGKIVAEFLRAREVHAAEFLRKKKDGVKL